MEEIRYSGKIIEVVQFKNGDKVFEKARRSPGVRALIVSDDKILLSREFRQEVGSYDFRLPGGKVFDKLQEYKNHLSEDLAPYASLAVVKEVKEEVGLVARNPKLLKVSKAGATVEWDLFYFLISDFEENENGQELEDGEDITFGWYTFQQAKDICLSGQMKEDRSVGVLLAFLIGQESKKTSIKRSAEESRV